MVQLLSIFIALGIMWSTSAEAAHFSLMPIPDAENEYLLLINTDLEHVNAWGVTLEFDPMLFSLTALQSYFLPSMVEVQHPQFSNTDGVLHFSGGMIGGVSGEIPLLRVTVTSVPSFRVASSTQALLHDGRGSPALITNDIVNIQ